VVQHRGTQVNHPRDYATTRGMMSSYGDSASRQRRSEFHPTLVEESGQFLPTHFASQNDGRESSIVPAHSHSMRGRAWGGDARSQQYLVEEHFFLHNG
jgi:hypothetical protein